MKHLVKIEGTTAAEVFPFSFYYYVYKSERSLFVSMCYSLLKRIEENGPS